MYQPTRQRQSPRITPFWNRIPSFFGYAFKPVPIGLTIGLALITIMTADSLWSLVVFAIMLKYCFEVMEQTALGEMSPPGISYRVLVEGYEQPAKQLFIFIFFFVLVSSVSSTFGPVIGTVLLFFGLFVFPASTMVLASTHSLLAALNPLLLITMIKRIGWPYLVLYAFLFFLGVGQERLEHFFLEDVPAALFYPIYSAIYLMFSIVTFHMMGYVLLQYHEEMGEPAPKQLTETDPNDEKLFYFHSCMAEGKVDAAREELRGLVKEEPDNLTLRWRTHNFLLAHPNKNDLTRHGNSYLPLLIRCGDCARAAEVYLDCLRADSDFRPEHGATFYPLAQTLREIGRSKEAVKLTKRFHTHFPNSDQTPKLYLLAAKILSEDLNRDDLAEKMLRYLVRSFPGHELKREITDYLHRVQQLSSI